MISALRCDGPSVFGRCAAGPLYRIGPTYVCGRHIDWLLRQMSWHQVDHVQVYAMPATHGRCSS